MSTDVRRDKLVGLLAFVALLLSLVLPVGALWDQTTKRSLESYSVASYGAHGVEVDPGLIYGVLYAVAAVGVVVWLVACLVAWLSKRGVLVALICANVVTIALAVTLLGVREYTDPIYPLLWGALCAVPAVAGLAAVVIVWRWKAVAQ